MSDSSATSNVSGSERESAARRQADVLLHLSQATNAALSAEEVFEPALEAIQAMLDVDRSAILLFDAQGVMRFVAWRKLSLAYRRVAEGHSPWSREERAARPIWVEDAQRDETLAAYRRLFQQEGIGALGFVPLTRQGQLLGKVMVYAPAPRCFTAREEQLAVAVAGEVAEAIARVQLIAAERAAREKAELLAARASRLQAITAALSQSSTQDEVNQVVVAQGAAAVGAATGGLWLVRDGLAVLDRFVGYSERAEAYRRLPLDKTNSPVTEAIQTQKAVWLHGRRHFEEAYPPLGQAGGQRPEMAIACLPMQVEGRCIGALAFTFDEARAFPEDERNFLLILAQYCAQAIERARLFERERQARAEAEAAHERTRVLLEASVILSSSLDFQETLHRLSRLAVPRMADWCAIDVVTGPEDQPRQLVVAHTDPTKEEAARAFWRRFPPVPDAPQGLPRVMRTGKAELYSEITEELLAGSARDEEHLRLLRAAGLRSMLIAPLVARGKVFGTLTFVSTESGRHYSQADLELGELLGQRAGIAVDNALLYEAAQRASRAREEVLAVVSHDLRNPLAVVLQGASVLLQLNLRESGGARARATAERIQRSSERMARLLDDLHDYSSIQGGRLKITVAPCEGPEVVEATVEMFSALAQERMVRLTTPTTEPIPKVQGDRNRLIQALSNLVSNAVKVTASGGSVWVRVERQGAEAVFSVQDTGPGIAPQDLGKVFERYWRGERAGYQGTGLGLAIARGIVEAHGGRIWAESQLGVGSRFFFSIPLAGA